MLQELAEQTGAQSWAIASMLFFLAIWLFIAVRVYRAGTQEMDACARIALDDDDWQPTVPPQSGDSAA